MYIIIFTALLSGAIGINDNAREFPGKTRYATLEECETARADARMWLIRARHNQTSVIVTTECRGV